MGLDQYAYARAATPDALVDFPEYGADEQIAYWRKHPDLHGWMHQLYLSKGGDHDSDFNVQTVLVDADDLDRLEKDVKSGALPSTQGFFFGTSQPEDDDVTLKFIKDARERIANGETVFYTSWW